MRLGLTEAFGVALAGAPARLISGAGRQLPAAVRRWHGSATGEDCWLLERCTGPTVDLGCGPGRLVTALQDRGVPTLGVDCSRQAVRECRSRGGTVLHRDVFAPLPGEGRWHHALLADGNIRIGGDPVTQPYLGRWLAVCATLLAGSAALLATRVAVRRAARHRAPAR